MTVVAYIGIGSNLEKPALQVRDALASLDQPPELRCTRRSSLYETAPIGWTDQPAFINAVAEVETSLGPHALLDRLREIEKAQGRIRRADSPRNGPRTLDLDLLLYDRKTISDADLEVPHPRMPDRAFVIVPLLEIAADAWIPGVGPARDCLPRVANQLIRKVAS